MCIECLGKYIIHFNFACWLKENDIIDVNLINKEIDYLKDELDQLDKESENLDYKIEIGTKNIDEIDIQRKREELKLDIEYDETKLLIKNADRAISDYSQRIKRSVLEDPLDTEINELSTKRKDVEHEIKSNVHELK